MIYVLLLEQGKIYVGYSERTNGERFLEHFNHSGSRWTVKYKPVQVLQILEGGRNDEDEMTLKMMHKYGWWNVRGGNWCQVEMCTCPKALLEWQQVNIPVKLAKCRKQICKRCGRNSEKCFAKTTLSGKALMTNGKFACKVEGKNEIDIYTRAFVMWHRLHNIMTFESAQKKLKRCNRCGRNSHTIEKCYAKSTLAGKLIATDNHDRLSRMEVDSCIRALIEWQRLNMPTKIVQRMNMYLCQRCGRNSHSIEQCFAKTSLAGETINDSKSNTKFHALGMQGI